MNQNLNTVLAAALELPPPQQRRLIEELRKRALPEKKKTGDVTKFFGTINSGDPNSADNDKIDADLAAGARAAETRDLGGVRRRRRRHFPERRRGGSGEAKAHLIRSDNGQLQPVLDGRARD